MHVEFAVAGSLWQLHVKPSAVSVTIDTSTVLTFDREGRPRSALIEGVHYRRGLDGRVRARVTGGVQGQRWLSAHEAQKLWEEVGQRLRLLEDHAVHDVPGVAGSPPDWRQWLQRLLRWDRRRLAADAARFREIYISVPILPPDRYNALVVQVTRGCAWNRCTFCDLYRDRPYTALTTIQLDEHLAEVRAFFGEGLQSRRHLFLGDANLLALPPHRLLPHLARVRAAFPEPALRQMSGFADVLGPRRYSDDDLASMARVGLRRLYFGLESGSAAVRGLLGKAGDARDAVTAMRRLHESGISVGVIVLLGAGGDGLAHDHATCTAQILKDMRLDAADAVFFSPLRPGREYCRQALAAGLRLLDETAMQAQAASLSAALVPRRDGGPRRAIYDLEDFIY